MPIISQQKLIIEPLGKQHERTVFDCGVEPLGRYIREQAGQDAKKKIAVTFVLVGDTATSIAGYYTLSSTNIDVGELPKNITKKLSRYPLMPATLIGRLAVDKSYQARGYGEILLVDALKRSLISTQQIGSVAVVVDAKDDNAKAFYEHFQFIPFINYPNRLFLPMAIIEEYFS